MIELLRKRRSIRKFQDQIIEQEKIGILIEAITRSPSSRNRQPWSFDFIEDKVILKQLSTAKSQGAEFIAGAPLGVVISGDENISDVWIEDCSIAATVLQLTAESLDLGSCWVQIRERPRTKDQTAEEFIQELLEMESHMRVECIIAIGYAAETKDPVPVSELDTARIRSLKNG